MLTGPMGRKYMRHVYFPNIYSLDDIVNRLYELPLINDARFVFSPDITLTEVKVTKKFKEMGLILFKGGATFAVPRQGRTLCGKVRRRVPVSEVLGRVNASIKKLN